MQVRTPLAKDPYGWTNGAQNAVLIKWQSCRPAGPLGEPDFYDSHDLHDIRQYSPDSPGDHLSRALHKDLRPLLCHFLNSL
jgi:hypothetical protein